MYLVSLQGQGTSFWSGSSGAPIECSALTKKPSVPILSSAAWPIRVIVRIDTTTYSESVISTPSLGSSAPSGPMQNGTTHGATAHATAVEVGHDPAHLGRIHPVVGGACVDFALRTDIGAGLHTRD